MKQETRWSCLITLGFAPQNMQLMVTRIAGVLLFRWRIQYVENEHSFQRYSTRGPEIIPVCKWLASKRCVHSVVNHWVLLLRVVVESWRRRPRQHQNWLVLSSHLQLHPKEWPVDVGSFACTFAPGPISKKGREAFRLKTPPRGPGL